MYFFFVCFVFVTPHLPSVVFVKLAHGMSWNVLRISVMPIDI